MSNSRVCATSLTQLELIQQALERVCQEWHTAKQPEDQQVEQGQNEWQGQVQVGTAGQNEIPCNQYSARNTRGCDIVVRQDDMPKHTYADVGLFWDERAGAYSWLMDEHVRGEHDSFRQDVESLYGALEASQENQQIGAIALTDATPATDAQLGDGWMVEMEIDEEDLKRFNIVLPGATV